MTLNTTSNIPTGEKVETIVLSFLQDGCETGTFGSIQRQADGAMHVTADGQEFVVRTNQIGWSVKCDGFEAIDHDLLEAARLAALPNW